MLAITYQSPINRLRSTASTTGIGSAVLQALTISNKTVGTRTLSNFTVYFCFLHSIRHSISLAIELDPNSVANGFGLFVKKALPLTILTGVFSFIALYLLTNSYNLDSAILKVIFIGLASLTFPHILLEYFLEKNEK